MTDMDAINQGFSQEALNYDSDNDINPVIRWARTLIRDEIVRYFPAGSSILEINAGTGIDAAWMVEHGYHVHATDIADGMIAAIRAKIQLANHDGKFTVQKLSFTELENADYAPFDGVFSNFGGLNCTPDLKRVANGVKKILKPGGYVIWVFMPPICPWELIQIFRGRVRFALRRLSRGGVIANVAGARIPTYYFTSSQVMKQLGEDFKMIHLQSFSLFCPPMNMFGAIGRFPRIVKFLMRLDHKLGRLPIFNQCGDFLVLVARYSDHRN